MKSSWRQRRLDAKDWPVAAHRPELCDLVARHGLSADDVKWVEYDVIDAPLLRFGVYRLDEQGRRYLEPGTDDVAMYQVERALADALPEWWQPA